MYSLFEVVSEVEKVLLLSSLSLAEIESYPRIEGKVYSLELEKNSNIEVIY